MASGSGVIARRSLSDAWKELPPEWLDGLNVKLDVASPVYHPERNKYGVKCGQGEQRGRSPRDEQLSPRCPWLALPSYLLADLNAWETSGWIVAQDPYGWFMCAAGEYGGARETSRPCDSPPAAAGGTAASSKAAARPTTSGRSRAGGASQGRRAAGRCDEAGAIDKERERGREPRAPRQSNLVAKVVVAGRAYDDAAVSPVVRQTLQHWAYTLTKSDFGVSGGRGGLAESSSAPTLPLRVCTDAGAKAYRKTGKAPFAVTGGGGAGKGGGAKAES